MLILIEITLLMLEITLAIAIWFIFKTINLIKKENKETTPKKIRTHAKIKTSNYDNSFGKRGYEQFKNEKTGLYEPQKPHQGIELKKQKED